MEQETATELAATGITGLNDILGGGLTAGKMNLLSGGPGTGKTTFALHFLAEGIKSGERCLYITVGGAEKDFIALAKSAGIPIDSDLFSIHLVEIGAEILDGPEQRIFHSAESEPASAMNEMLAEFKRVKPKRLVIDSLSDLRFLAEDSASYRRLILALRQEFYAEACTVLLTNNVSFSRSEIDLHLETVCQGVINLEQLVIGYGPTRRRLLVLKLRGRAYRSGWHDFRITVEGIEVFPTLVAGEHRQAAPSELILSGNADLDLIFGGGFHRGSTLAIIGASGTGKTTMANQYVAAAAKNGDHVAIYLFEESEVSYRRRAEGLGLSIDGFIDKGLVALNHVGVAELSAGEFAARLRQEVEENGVRTVVLDTLNGYANAMLDEEYLILQLHELFAYLSHKGVTTFLVVEEHGFGHPALEVKNVNYLADAILLLRFFEHRGEIKRAVSVVKKRSGNHEKTIREMTLSGAGIALGETLIEMQGVLTGAPILEA